MPGQSQRLRVLRVPSETLRRVKVPHIGTLRTPLWLSTGTRDPDAPPAAARAFVSAVAKVRDALVSSGIACGWARSQLHRRRAPAGPGLAVTLHCLHAAGSTGFDTVPTVSPNLRHEEGRAKFFLWRAPAPQRAMIICPAGAAHPAEGHVQGLPDRPLRDVRARRAGGGDGLVAEPPAVTVLLREP